MSEGKLLAILLAITVPLFVALEVYIAKHPSSTRVTISIKDTSDR